MSVYRNGEWSHTQTRDKWFTPDGSGGAVSPMVAIDDAGNMGVVWMQTGDVDTHVYKSQFFPIP